MRQTQRTIYWLIVLSLWFVLPANAKPAPAFDSFIATSDNGKTPNQSAEVHFDCSDKVFAVIKSSETTNHKSRTHDLIVNWFDPTDKLEQETRYEFTSFGKGTFVWAWLRLSAPAGAAIGRIFDPAFGMGEFIGEWRAEIEIDGQKIATHRFKVLC